MSQIITPKDCPDHEVVGHTFIGWNGATFICDSYDPRIGYWMTNTDDATDRRNVSERAIGKTFHKRKDSAARSAAAPSSEPKV